MTRTVKIGRLPRTSDIAPHRRRLHVRGKPMWSPPPPRLLLAGVPTAPPGSRATCSRPTRECPFPGRRGGPDHGLKLRIPGGPRLRTLLILCEGVRESRTPGLTLHSRRGRSRRRTRREAGGPVRLRRPAGSTPLRPAARPWAGRRLRETPTPRRTAFGDSAEGHAFGARRSGVGRRIMRNELTRPTRPARNGISRAICSASGRASVLIRMISCWIGSGWPASSS